MLNFGGVTPENDVFFSNDPASLWKASLSLRAVFNKTLAPPKFNSLPLKNGWFFKTILALWDGNFSGATYQTSDGYERADPRPTDPEKQPEYLC